MTDVPSLDDLVRGIAPGPALERLEAASDLADRLRGRGDEVLDQLVAVARDAGASWSEIGRALGASKQAAQQRFAGLADPPPGTAPFGLVGAAAGVLSVAGDEARDLGHNSIRPEHLVLGLLADAQEPAARTLAELGVSTEDVRARVGERLGRAAPRPTGTLGVAPQTKRLLEHARTIANRLDHRCAGGEHILLAAVSRKLSSPAATLLEDCGASPDLVRDELTRRIVHESPELAARIKSRMIVSGSRVRVRSRA